MSERLGSWDITDAMAVKEKRRKPRPVQKWQEDYVLAHADVFPRRLIAEAAKLPVSTVYTILERHGVKMRDYGAAKRRAEEVAQKHWREMTYREMSELAKVSNGTVLRAVKRLGIDKLPGYKELMYQRHLATMHHCHAAKWQSSPEGRKKASIKRRVLVRREYERVAMGLPQRTRLHLRDLALTAKTHKQRWALTKRGYIIDPECPTRLLYNADTKRTRFEDLLNRRHGFTFKAIDNTNDNEVKD